MRQGVQGISDLITSPGIVNLDFADVKTVMQNQGSALMGIGTATGENAAAEATKQAISSPLLEVSIDGAENVLLNITGGLNLSLVATEEASNIVSQAATKDVNIIFGTSINPDLEDEVIVTVVATGIDKKEKQGKKNGIPREINGVSKSPVRGNEFENVEKKEFNVFGSNSDFSDGDDDLSVPPFLNHRNNQ